MNGFVDADLGGAWSTSVSRAGQGKSGRYRTVLAFRRGDRAVFLLGFAKNVRANIDAEELDELKKLARKFLQLSPVQIAALIAGDELMEVGYDDADEG